MDQRETSRHAVTALVWAVLGWTVLPLIGAGLALVYAGRAERAIRRDPDWLRGWQMAGAARSLATVWFVMLLLGLLTVGAVLVVQLARTTP